MGLGKAPKGSVSPTDQHRSSAPGTDSPHTAREGGTEAPRSPEAVPGVLELGRSGGLGGPGSGQDRRGRRGRRAGGVHLGGAGEAEGMGTGQSGMKGCMCREDGGMKADRKSVV